MTDDDVSQVEIAWFAGLFEGEGCISINPNGATSLQISMTDEDVIARVKALFPDCNNVAPFQAKQTAAMHQLPKVRHTWKIGKPEEVQRILELIFPYLGDRRRARAREILDHIEALGLGVCDACGKRLQGRRNHNCGPREARPFRWQLSVREDQLA